MCDIDENKTYEPQPANRTQVSYNAYNTSNQFLSIILLSISGQILQELIDHHN